MNQARKTGVLSIIGPGILVAATGVGAGDLATGAFTGNKLGVAVLWAVLVGAGLKFVLSEGLARWQLATGETLLEGCARHFGRPVQYLFLVYLLFWSFFVGLALMSACGVTAHAILPLFGDETDKGAKTGKIVFGIVHSVVAVVLVRRGGYRLFEKLMRVCIAVMFMTVVVTAIAVGPSWQSVFRGLFIPTIPDAFGEGLEWTVALMGGVGGTLTILCYGYWIREEGREGIGDLRVCRIDLAAGYTMTTLFGLGMVIIGSTVTVPDQGKGVTLLVRLAEQLETQLGTAAHWAFLIGAWGAVFSSLLGVWQSVPYLFADFLALTRRRSDEAPVPPVETGSISYRAYLYGLSIIPAAGLSVDFEKTQKLYAIIGAAFIPMLALALLFLNGRADWVGKDNRNKWPTIIVLAAAILFFVLAGWFEIRTKLFV